MHDFCYVSKKEAAPVKAELLDIIHEVQDMTARTPSFIWIPRITKPRIITKMSDLAQQTTNGSAMR